VPTDTSYSIADLARISGLSVRTIRYYLAQGLIPASGEAGPGAHYGQGHLDRLQLIKRLQTQFLPNAEIRRRLAPLSDAEVAGLAAESVPTATASTSSALDYVRGVLGAADVRGEAGAKTLPAAPPPPAPVLRMSMPQAARDAAPPSPPMPPPSAIAGAAEATSDYEPPSPDRSQWERLSLGENIEIHIRRPLSRPEQRRVERLITIARQVLDEDKG
jgi:DNA-binding transcriptional MerR regulator